MENLAFVGWTGSGIDIDVLMDATDLNPAVANLPKDLIDLSVGRDFLSEVGEYDVVIVCYAFVGDENAPAGEPTLAVSPLHSPDAWRNRLLATKAKDIMLFGHDPRSEVSSAYVGSLPGYRSETKILPDQTKVWRYILKEPHGQAESPVSGQQVEVPGEGDAA